MEATAMTIMVDGKEMSLTELNQLIETAKGLQRTVKAAKKEAKAKGIKIDADKVAKEKSHEYALLVANFLPTVEENIETISKMFTDSRSDSDDLTSGQDSISFNVTSEYQVIIRSSSITKAKKAKRDAEAKETRTE